MNTEKITAADGIELEHRSRRIAFKWRFFLGFLLGGTVLANGVILLAALSDGGPRPVPNAYAKALRWDQEHARGDSEK